MLLLWMSAEHGGKLSSAQLSSAQLMLAAAAVSCGLLLSAQSTQGPYCGTAAASAAAAHTTY
jgi:hypothetical protein